MTTSTDIYTRLSDYFPQEAEKSRTKGGTKLTYIPVSEVISRMNKVLGVGYWDQQVVSVYRDHLDPDFIVAHVRVTATINGERIVRDGLGGQTIKRTKAGDIVDLGDEFKGAVSDAFKKACQTLGVGLYLARSEEAMEADIHNDAAPAPAPVVEVDPENAELYATLKTHLDGFNDDTTAEIKSWWKATFPGERPPSAASTREQLVEAIGWCVERMVGEAAA
jgi:hypothetical protein